MEWRAIEDIPVNFVISEKEAGISFCLLDGKTDYAGFFGKDPAFMNWVKDVFQYTGIKEQEFDSYPFRVRLFRFSSPNVEFTCKLWLISHTPP